MSFLPGLHLCRLFYQEAVRPLLDEVVPGLVHAAARAGPGSEVLGFDSERSADHDWGPRLELFLSTGDVARHGAHLSAVLADRLPARFRGRPTSFAPAGARVQVMTDTSGPVAHRVDVTDVATWSVRRLGFDARHPVRDADWLATPAQLLAEVTGGAVFHDGPGELTGLRERLRWYPDGVWRRVLAAQWDRIAQQEAFVGRTAEAGDDLGSRVIAARLAQEVMRLCLLLGGRYPPYSKWLGSAFAALPGTAGIGSSLAEAVETGDPVRRQAALCDAYEAAGRRQNALGLAPPVPAVRRPYFDRPYPVIDAARFVAALLRPGPAGGAVDQWVDDPRILGDPAAARAVQAAREGVTRPGAAG